MKTELKEGSIAPHFNLPDASGKKVKLSDFLGEKNIVLYFYPKDLTPGCTVEACDFSDHHKLFDKKEAVIIGISLDPPSQHQKFINKHDLKIILLSDEKHEVSEKYGVYQEKSLYGKKFMGIVRSTFVIGKNGKIVKVFPKVKVKGHAEEVLNVLNKSSLP